MVGRVVTLLVAGLALPGIARALEPDRSADRPAASQAAPPSPPLEPQPPATATARPGKAAAPVAPAPPPEPVRVSDDPRPSFGPDTFVATMKAADRYRLLVEAGGWPTVPNEATRLKPGDHGPAVEILRRRLALAGDLPEGEAGGFDPALAAALRRFQFRHGLEETGTVGPRTLAALDVPAETRLRQLQASAARLIGSKFPFGERYVAVNIPSATVEAVDRGAVARRYVAVVGKPDRPSPLVETRVTSVNFNPTWTVPVSLIRKDIIPHVRKDPNYLAKMKIRLFDAQGTEIDPGTLDWSTERAANYTIRQDAGEANSLGEVRIDMPNRHAVYMHDTPSKRLFARTGRAQSSGCVRVSDVKALVGWLLAGTPGPGGPGTAWGPAEIDAAVASRARLDARLARPVPVAWVYLTGYGMPDGSVHFRDDVYGLDAPRDTALPSALPPALPSDKGALTIDALVTSSIGIVR